MPLQKSANANIVSFMINVKVKGIVNKVFLSKAYKKKMPRIMRFYYRLSKRNLSSKSFVFIPELVINVCKNNLKLLFHKVF